MLTHSLASLNQFSNRYLYNDHGEFAPMYCLTHNIHFSQVKTNIKNIYRSNAKAINDKFDHFHPKTTFVLGAIFAIAIPKLLSRFFQFYYFMRVWFLLRRPHRLAGHATAEQKQKQSNTSIAVGNNPHLTDQILNKNGFAVGYSYAAKSPVWVSYFFCSRSISQKSETKSTRVPNLSRKLKERYDFRPDPEISDAQFRAVTSDFSNTNYDRGHLVSIANIGNLSESARFDASLLSCVALQHPALNRSGGSWHRLERLMRIWARRLPSSSFAAVCGPLFDVPDDSKKARKRNGMTRGMNMNPFSRKFFFWERIFSLLRNQPKQLEKKDDDDHQPSNFRKINGIAVPTHFYMAILHVQSGKSIAFLIENRESGGRATLASKCVSVDELESMCSSPTKFGLDGLRIFRKLPFWYRPFVWQRKRVDLDFWLLTDWRNNASATKDGKKPRKSKQEKAELTVAEKMFYAAKKR